jgi:hypothetical protein
VAGRARRPYRTGSHLGGVKNIQDTVASFGTKKNPMKIKPGNAEVLDSAMQDGIPLMTRDQQLYKKIERLGCPDERY